MFGQPDTPYVLVNGQFIPTAQYQDQGTYGSGTYDPNSLGMSGLTGIINSLSARPGTYGVTTSQGEGSTPQNGISSLQAADLVSQYYPNIDLSKPMTLAQANSVLGIDLSKTGFGMMPAATQQALLANPKALINSAAYTYGFDTKGVNKDFPAESYKNVTYDPTQGQLVSGLNDSSRISIPDPGSGLLEGLTQLAGYAGMALGVGGLMGGAGAATDALDALSLSDPATYDAITFGDAQTASQALAGLAQSNPSVYSAVVDQMSANPTSLGLNAATSDVVNSAAPLTNTQASISDILNSGDLSGTSASNIVPTSGSTTIPDSQLASSSIDWTGATPSTLSNTNDLSWLDQLISGTPTDLSNSTGALGSTGMDLTNTLGSANNIDWTTGDLNSVGGGDLSFLDSYMPNTAAVGGAGGATGVLDTLGSAGAASTGVGWLDQLLNGTTTDLAASTAGGTAGTDVGGTIGGAATGAVTSGLSSLLKNADGSTSTLGTALAALLGGTALAGVLGDKAATSSSTTTNTPTQPTWLSNDQQQIGNAITSIPTVAPQYTQPLAAGLSTNQQSGIGLADQATGAWAPLLGQAVQTATQGATTLPNTDLTQYMNPYLSAVLAPTLNTINNQYDQQQASQDLASASHGAFGGSRNLNLTGQTSLDRSKALSDAAAGVYGTGYNTAVSNALSDKTNMLNAGNTIANLSTDYQNALGKDVSQLMSTGQTAQTTQQTAYDKAYQDYLTQLQYPLTAAGSVSSALSNVSPKVYPSTSTTNITGAQPNTAANLFGAGTTLAGLLGQLGYFGSTTTPGG